MYPLFTHIIECAHNKATCGRSCFWTRHFVELAVNFLSSSTEADAKSSRGTDSTRNNQHSIHIRVFAVLVTFSRFASLPATAIGYGKHWRTASCQRSVSFVINEDRFDLIVRQPGHCSVDAWCHADDASFAQRRVLARLVDLRHCMSLIDVLQRDVRKALEQYVNLTRRRKWPSLCTDRHRPTATSKHGGDQIE